MRDGKELRELEPGDRRRLNDFRNAWRKMTPEQRRDALDWMWTERRAHEVAFGEVFLAVQPEGEAGDYFDESIIRSAHL